jgi:hypothetical protein
MTDDANTPIASADDIAAMAQAVVSDDLAPGFYWIRLDGLPPEIARRDAEAREWLLIGSDSGIPDGHPAEIVVLSGPLDVPDVSDAPRAG